MLWFLGDTHENFGHILPAIQRAAAEGRQPDAVIFLGDIETSRPFELELAPIRAAGVEVRWIHGNHDVDTPELWANLAAAMPCNIDGLVVEVAGMRIAGLGGIFREAIWYPTRGSVAGLMPRYACYDAYCDALNAKRESVERRLRASRTPAADAAAAEKIRASKELTHRSSIFWNVYAQLWDQKADILVTHEAPSCHPSGFEAIDELAQAMGVTTVFHGHHHDRIDYSGWTDRLGFRTYGVGFCGITDELGNVIRAGDRDG